MKKFVCSQCEAMTYTEGSPWDDLVKIIPCDCVTSRIQELEEQVQDLESRLYCRIKQDEMC